jgi:hypothetical protein
MALAVSEIDLHADGVLNVPQSGKMDRIFGSVLI